MVLEVTNIWSYLFNVAPVVFVMGLAIWQLWKKNNQLTDQIYNRDLDNLETLNHISHAIEKVNIDGNRHFKELKEHISERTGFIQDHLNRK